MRIIISQAMIREAATQCNAGRRGAGLGRKLKILARYPHYRFQKKADFPALAFAHAGRSAFDGSKAS
jgi:hypothetical protein